MGGTHALSLPTHQHRPLGNGLAAWHRRMGQFRMVAVAHCPCQTGSAGEPAVGRMGRRVFRLHGATVGDDHALLHPHLSGAGGAGGMGNHRTGTAGKTCRTVPSGSAGFRFGGVDHRRRIYHAMGGDVHQHLPQSAHPRAGKSLGMGKRAQRFRHAHRIARKRNGEHERRAVRDRQNPTDQHRHSQAFGYA